MKSIAQYVAGIFFLGALIFGQLPQAQAAVPHLINYQGKLTDASGQPLEGSFELTFRIYDAENAGNLLWEEAQTGVVIQKGIFNILLGAVTNLNLPFTIPYFLEIKVGSEVMSPRQRITSAGYAIRAETADNGVPPGTIVMWSGSIASIPLGWQLCDGTNGTPDLRDQFIVGARQDDGEVPKTIVAGALAKTGGEATHILTLDELPTSVFTRIAQGPYCDLGDVGWLLNTDYTHYTYFGANRTNFGGGLAHNNLPPYYALAFIMKK
jgi:microcystin-dependent protein